MDAKQYTEGLAELRGLRDEIKKAESALAKLYGKRNQQVKKVAAYKKAKAERIAPAAGRTIKDIVDLAPHLAPASAPTPQPPEAADAEPSAAAGPGAAAPAMTPVALQPTTEQAPAAEPQDEIPAAEDSEPVADTGTEPDTGEEHALPAAEAIAASDEAPAKPRDLPTIPEGEQGDRWFTVADKLVSTRPNFQRQQARPTVFLDADTGDLVHRDQRIRLDLGSGSADEILTAVYAHVPENIERIYITAGDPWHRDAERYPYLKDAVRAWLDAPTPSGWKVESTRGHDRLAGHFLHERTPVGRWQRGSQHTEIRSINEWFNPDGVDVATVRNAFTLLWQTLKKDWPDVVLMGSPSQTGRDLWTRTIPSKPSAKWSGGYPVMSDEIRQLLHATSGQGRTELITPPRVPEQLPALHEFDRTLAYGKHTWASGVGAPQRVTAATFASWSEKEQNNALFAPSHWKVRVTIPQGWNHVGILPFAVEGDRSWIYPHEAGRTFTTWAGGAEVNAALRNPLKMPWKVQILDGLLWESGTPLKDWSQKLKQSWAALEAAAVASGTDELRQAYKLASRGVRSILLYGIGGFAQRPTLTTGSVPIGQESEIPDGARITGMVDETVTWERTQMSRNPNAHPEWAAGVWSAARAALLSTRAKASDGQTVHVGALHLPPGSVVAFRTDAIYTTARPDWPYNGEPGDYRLKGFLDHPVAAPTTDSEFYTVRDLGRARLHEHQNTLV